MATQTMAVPGTRAMAADVTHGALRIVAGLLFWQHGAQKTLGWLGGVGGPGNTVDLMSLYGLAGIIEMIGGILILLGLFTRPVAFIAAGEMAFAYFMSHVARGFWPIQNGGELAALYAFVFLFLAASGGGAFSLDRAVRRKADLPRASVDEPARRDAAA